MVTIAPDQPRSRPLALQHRRVIGVDLRDDQRHIRLHPVVARVAEDDMPGGGQPRLDLRPPTSAGRAEKRIGLVSSSSGAAHDQVARALRARRLAAARSPPRRTAGPRRASEPRHLAQLEPRVVGQQLDEPLPDRARRRQDADGDTVAV